MDQVGLTHLRGGLMWVRPNELDQLVLTALPTTGLGQLSLVQSAKAFEQQVAREARFYGALIR